MPGSTTELNLSTAVDSDDNADYLTINLANSLRTLDSLFNNVTGHTHGGAHQGGPIGAGAIPAGLITSTMIADGTITSADIAANTITGANIAAKTIVGGNIVDGTIGSQQLYDGGVATVDLADGAVTTVKMGGQAVTAWLGSYTAIPTWSSTSQGAWLNTPVSVGPVTISGGAAIPGSYVEISFSAILAHSSGQGSFWYLALGQDGTPVGSYGVGQVSYAGQNVTSSFTVLIQPPAGSHTYSLMIYNGAAGTISLNGAVTSTLYVREVRR